MTQRNRYHSHSLRVRALVASLTLTAAALIIGSAQAQESSEVFKARLSPLGVTGATVNTTTGAGAITATLKGNVLAVQGTFERLTGVATEANVRRGPKAIPGPIVATLEFTKGSQGSVNGVLTLTPALIEDLQAGRLYVQIHSERAPEGSVRGWLLK
jgi:hypothetical protein